MLHEEQDRIVAEARRIYTVVAVNFPAQQIYYRDPQRTHLVRRTTFAGFLRREEGKVIPEDIAHG